MARKELDSRIKNLGQKFAERLRRERQLVNLSQRELSEQANVPLDTVRSIENGRILSPGLFIAADLIRALNGKIDEWIPKRARSKR